jgi:DnaJ-class molecular chaperone
MKNQTPKVKCETCDGKGKRGREKCIKCNGTGFVNLLLD